MSHDKKVAEDLSRADFINKWVESSLDQDPEHDIQFPPELFVTIDDKAPELITEKTKSSIKSYPFISISSNSQNHENSPSPLQLIDFPASSSIIKSKSSQPLNSIDIAPDQLILKYSENDVEKTDEWGFDCDNLDKDNSPAHSQSSIIFNDAPECSSPSAANSDNGSIIIFRDKKSNSPIIFTPKNLLSISPHSTPATLVKKDHPSSDSIKSVAHIQAGSEIFGNSSNRKLSSNNSDFNTPTITKFNSGTLST
ncbi:hypothetical protein AYI68_g2634 [Smittium mucronatum]|uniref:Uncharacterized protein n=1 Tax=Smittium mucronatum TaxID=133383 RepID=A0A1R0H274_9FUNG|nr:hypothetical protein AYI68_g2634 [Smittium mucronatum]